MIPGIAIVDLVNVTKMTADRVRGTKVNVVPVNYTKTTVDRVKDSTTTPDARIEKTIDLTTEPMIVFTTTDLTIDPMTVPKTRGIKIRGMLGAEIPLIY